MEREVWLKARPHVRIAVKGEDAVKEVRRLPILAAFFVKSVVEVNDGVEHPFLPRALDVMKEVTKKEPEATKLEIAYEIYRGDMESLLGEAKAYVIKVASCETPYSNMKFEARRAWAIGYDWKKKIAAREPSLGKYVYVDGSGNELRASVRVFIKLPVVTREFETLFCKAVGAPAAAGSVDQEIEELERLVAEKERELAELKAKLEELKRLRSVPGRVASLAPLDEASGEGVGA